MTTLTGKGLTIDLCALGSSMILIGVSPYNKYVDGVRTEQIIGYKYSVILTEHNFQQLDVKIEGEKVLDLKTGESIKVKFHDLTVMPYVQTRNGYSKLSFTASASGVEPVG